MARRSLPDPKVDLRLVLDRLALTVHLVSGASLPSWGFARRSRIRRSKLFW
jgi:hypothetical protein